MRAPDIDPQKFVELWNQAGGSVTEVARILGRSDSSVGNTRRRVERNLGITLHASSPHSSRTAQAISRVKNKSPRINLDIEDGMIVVGSDAHRWPGPLTTAQRAFVRFIKEFSPSHIVLNGDVFDGATTSRHSRIQWDQRPNTKEELEACKVFTDAIEAAGKGRRLWTWGNHDMRFSTRLASMVPEYEGVPGLALQDHFPSWEYCMAIFVNDHTVIKHQHRMGVHAAYNNALVSGRTMVTGHLHSLKVTPWTDYNGSRWGVDTGCLADFDGPQFDYGQEGPQNHRSGFAVLTFHKGKLLWPELVAVHGPDEVEFRGKVYQV